MTKAFIICRYFLRPGCVSVYNFLSLCSLQFEVDYLVEKSSPKLDGLLGERKAFIQRMEIIFIRKSFLNLI